MPRGRCARTSCGSGARRRRKRHLLQTEMVFPQIVGAFPGCWFGCTGWACAPDGNVVLQSFRDREDLHADRVRYEVVMGDTRKPAEGTQDGDAVTTEVGSASAAEPDLRSMLEQAEAEAAAAEAAAAEAQAKVRAMRSEHGDEVDLAEPREPRRLWPPSWPVVAKTVAALVIVAALIGSGYIVWNHYEASAQRQNEQEFIDTAKQGVVDLTSIDFKIVKDQVKHIIDNATGSFRDDFIARADQFIKVSEASKAVAKG